MLDGAALLDQLVGSDLHHFLGIFILNIESWDDRPFSILYSAGE